MNTTPPTGYIAEGYDGNTATKGFVTVWQVRDEEGRWHITESSRMARAMSICFISHEGQKDRAGEPYFKHPLAVRDLLSNDGEDAQIVGLLHDVVEDSDKFTLDEIENWFGPRVASGVDAMTRRSSETYNEYIDRIRRHHLGRSVKMADVKHNMSPDRKFGEPGEYASMMERYEQTMRKLVFVRTLTAHERELADEAMQDVMETFQHKATATEITRISITGYLRSKTGWDWFVTFGRDYDKDGKFVGYNGQLSIHPWQIDDWAIAEGEPGQLDSQIIMKGVVS